MLPFTVGIGVESYLAFGIAYSVLFLFSLLFVRRGEASTVSQSRFVEIDGLRGILALAVFWFHIYTNVYPHSGVDQSTPKMFALSGHVGVILFFMITGFLFWGKIEKADGKPDWFGLFTSRFFRLVPLYWFLVLCLVIFATVLTGYNFQSNLKDYLVHILSWLAFRQGDLNGFRDVGVVAGPVWTLVYEWIFYLSLPTLAAGLLVARKSKFLRFILLVAIVTFALLGVQVTNSTSSSFFLYFILGGLAYHFRNLPMANRFFSKRYSAILPLISLVVLFLVFDFGYGFPQALLIFTVFFSIVSGCSFFGLLTTKPLRFLGEISYSLYLLHSMVLYILFDLILPGWVPVINNFWLFWVISTAVGCLLICLCSLTYRYIEQPFIALGKKMIAKRTTDPKP